MSTENAQEPAINPLSAPRIGDSLRGGRPAPPPLEPGSQIKTRRMNLDSEEPFDPTKKDQQSTRRVQQPKPEPTAAEPEEKPEPKPEKAKPAAAKPSPAPAKKDVKKAGEDDPAVSHFAKRMFGDRFADRLAKGPPGQKKDDKTKPAAAAKAAPAPAKPATAAAEEPKKGIAVTRSRPGLSSEDISTVARTAAEAAIAASKGTTKAEDQNASDDPAAGLDVTDRRAYEISQYMSKTKDQYKDLPSKMLEMAKRKTEYRRDWEKENPGKKFAWDDEEHTDFLNAVAPEFDEADYEDARIEMRAEAVADRRLSAANDRIRSLEQQTAGVGLKETIAKETQRSVKAFAAELAPNADWDLSSDEGLDTVLEKEDILGEIVATHVALMKDATEEAVKLFDGKGSFKLDLQKNKVHAWLVDTVEKYENTLDAKPDAEKLDPQGRLFLPRSEYYKLPENQQKKYWTMQREQVLWIIKDSLLTQARMKRDREVAKLKRYYDARGIEFDEDSIVALRKAAAAESEGEDTPPRTTVNTGGAEDDDNPPATGDTSRIDTTNGAVKSQASRASKAIMSRLFPRHAAKE